MNKIIILLVIVIVILAIITYYSFKGENVNLYEKYMHGLWKADEEFCEQCDADQFMLFIGDPNKNSNRNFVERSCYLLVTPDSANEKIVISYTKPRKVKDKYTLQVNIQGTELIPDEVEFEFDIIKGLVKISKDKTIYAILYRDNEVTDLAKNQEDEEVV